MNRLIGRYAALGIGLLGGIVVWLISTQVFPHYSLNHDEAVYLQQAAMLLDGQLSLWPPVEDAFRPWFFVEDGDRLYPKYSPVPAAMFSLGHLAGGYRLALVAIAAGNLVLVSAVVSEVYDRTVGILAALFVLSSPLFLLDSAVFLPYAPTTLLNLTFAYAYLRADRTNDWRWAAGAGIAVGLAFFARPYTAVLFAAPFIAHALWSAYVEWPELPTRHAATAAFGLGEVLLALFYNTAMTGSPWQFPYQAFAPRDGIGFGRRELIGHSVEYTVDLALRANGEVVSLFVTEWIAGGVFGAALATLGLTVVVRKGPRPRESVLAGLVGSIIVGNVMFWGNLNILGDIGIAGDGLIAVLGPYYHFDLLLPTAAFAALGIVSLRDRLLPFVTEPVDPRKARMTVVVILLVGIGVVGGVTVLEVQDRIDENRQVTSVYETAYEPFAGGPPPNSMVLLPTPYGDWLNHPFQQLRNEPGFEGGTVYAIEKHPFRLLDEFPDRRVFRYLYRGPWAPRVGSPNAAGLQRVHERRGPVIHLDTTVGIPDGAIGVTARLSSDDRSAYFTSSEPGDTVDLRLSVTDGVANISGDLRPLRNSTIGVKSRDTIKLSVFVDYGAGGGFVYRFELPIDATDDTVRAISPRITYCRAAHICTDGSAYLPEHVPDGITVRSELIAG